MSVPQRIKDLANKVRNEIYGRDVRESIAKSMEVTGETAEEAKERSLEQTDRVDTLIRENPQPSEVIDARGDFDILRDRLNSSDQQLAQNTSRLDDNAISPEEFTGNDYEKVQQAMDFALANGRSIRLARLYNLTGHPALLLNKNVSSDRRPLYFEGVGGGFRKDDAGFMFSAPVRNVGDMDFSNVKFTSVQGAGTCIFDTDHLIRIKWSGSTARNVDHIFITEKHLTQSMHFNGGSVVGGKGYAVSTPGGYDIQFGGGFFVEHREHFFIQPVKVHGTAAGELNTIRFRDIMVEGLSGRAFRFRRVDGLVIDSVFLESNAGGHIYFDDDSQLYGVEISNLRAYEREDTSLTSVIRWGGIIHSAKTEINISRNVPIHDTTAANGGEILSTKDLSRTNAGDVLSQIDPQGRLFDGRIVVGSSFRNDGYFTRFADGTQICQIKDLEVPYVNALRLGVTWNYPAGFLNSDVVSVTATVSDHASLEGLDRGVTQVGSITVKPYNSWADVRVYANSTQGNFVAGDKLRLNLIAFGRWK